MNAQRIFSALIFSNTAASTAAHDFGAWFLQKSLPDEGILGFLAPRWKKQPQITPPEK